MTTDLQAQVDALRWYYTIDLGGGVITKGSMTQRSGFR